MAAQRKCRICEQEPTRVVDFTWWTADHRRRILSERCDKHYFELVGVRTAGRIGVTIHRTAPVVFAA